MVSFGEIWNWVNIHSGNGLLPNGTKPLPCNIHLGAISQEMLKIYIYPWHEFEDD